MEPRQIGFLLADPEPSVRSAVAGVMLHFGEPTEDFVYLLKDKSADVRRTVVGSLATAGYDRKKLIPLLTDPDEDVRRTTASYLIHGDEPPLREAIEVLARMGDLDDYVVRALGPKTRLAMIPTAMEWLSQDHKSLQRLAQIVLIHPDGVPEQHLAAIKSLTQSENVVARQVSLRVLLRMSQDAESLAILRQSLEDPAVVESAIAAIAKWQLKQLLPDLRRLYEHDDETVCIRAATAVAQLDKKDTACIEILSANFEPQNMTNMAMVCSGLEHAGSRALAAKEILWQALDIGSERFELRWNGQVAKSSPTLPILRRLGDKAAPLIDEWLSNPQTTKIRLGQLLSFIAKNPDLPLQSSSSTILSRLGSTEHGHEIGQALTVLSSRPGLLTKHLQRFTAPDYSFVHGPVARCLASCTDRENAIVQLRKLVHSEEKNARATVCSSLVKLNADAELVANTVRDLFENHEDVGFHSDELWELTVHVARKEHDVIPLMIAVIERGTLQVRAILALEKLGEPAVPHLIKGLESESPAVRGSCAIALGGMKVEKAAPQLVQLLDDKQNYHRSNGHFLHERLISDDAITALAQLKPRPELLPKYIQALRTNPPNTQAAIAIGKLGSDVRRATRQLVEAATDKRHPNFAAAKVLTQITDGNIGLSGIRHYLSHFQPQTSYWCARENFDFIASLGKRAESLLPKLREIVEGERLYSPEVRVHAAYVLAKLEPQEERWRRFLERRANFTGSGWSTIASVSQDRLTELKEEHP